MAALPAERSPSLSGPERTATNAELLACVRALAAQGFAPATSGNFSIRVDARSAVITVSGVDKAEATAADLTVINLDGHSFPSGALGGGRPPSAETPLHAQLYRRFPDVGCILHTHSRVQTVASRVFAQAGRVQLQGYELLKAFDGITTHDTTLEVPVLRNQQDIPALAAELESHLADGRLRGYLVASHGLYTWGRDVARARRHLEAFEMLLACELETLRWAK
jgi:methylthioribulose-1-phosphate dehydratase